MIEVSDNRGTDNRGRTVLNFTEKTKEIGRISKQTQKNDASSCPLHCILIFMTFDFIKISHLPAGTLKYIFAGNQKHLSGIIEVCRLMDPA